MMCFLPSWEAADSVRREISSIWPALCWWHSRGSCCRGCVIVASNVSSVPRYKRVFLLHTWVVSQKRATKWGESTRFSPCSSVRFIISTATLNELLPFFTCLGIRLVLRSVLFSNQSRGRCCLATLCHLIRHRALRVARWRAIVVMRHPSQSGGRPVWHSFNEKHSCHSTNQNSFVPTPCFEFRYTSNCALFRERTVVFGRRICTLSFVLGFVCSGSSMQFWIRVVPPKCCFGFVLVRSSTTGPGNAFRKIHLSK